MSIDHGQDSPIEPIDLREGIQHLLSELYPHFLEQEALKLEDKALLDVSAYASGGGVVVGGQRGGSASEVKGHLAFGSIPPGFQPVEAVVELEVAAERRGQGGIGWSILNVGASKRTTRSHRLTLTFRPQQ